MSSGSGSSSESREVLPLVAARCRRVLNRSFLFESNGSRVDHENNGGVGLVQISTPPPRDGCVRAKRSPQKGTSCKLRVVLSFVLLPIYMYVHLCRAMPVSPNRQTTIPSQRPDTFRVPAPVAKTTCIA